MENISDINSSNNNLNTAFTEDDNSRQKRNKRITNAAEIEAELNASFSDDDDDEDYSSYSDDNWNETYVNIGEDIDISNPDILTEYVSWGEFSVLLCGYNVGIHIWFPDVLI